MHPKDKRDRYLKGSNKGKKRVRTESRRRPNHSDEETSEVIKKLARKRRDTTKPCNCLMCANPRRTFKELTLQEKKANESFSKDQTSDSTN